MWRQRVGPRCNTPVQHGSVPGSGSACLCQGPSRLEGILAAYARSLGSARQPRPPTHSPPNGDGSAGQTGCSDRRQCRHSVRPPLRSRTLGPVEPKVGRRVTPRLRSRGKPIPGISRRPDVDVMEVPGRERPGLVLPFAGLRPSLPGSLRLAAGARAGDTIGCSTRGSSRSGRHWQPATTPATAAAIAGAGAASRSGFSFL